MQMPATPAPAQNIPDFRRNATIGLALAALVILSPFGINNFLQGRYLLGTGAMAIVILLSANAWHIRRGRDTSWWLFAGIAPLVIIFLVLSLRTQGMIGVMWCYPSVISFYMMLSERKAWLANAVLLSVVLPQSWYILEPPLAIRMAASLVAVSVFTALFVRALTYQHNRLQALALMDPLTGLFNRSMLPEHLEQAIQQNRRSGTPMALAIVDLDHFKAINDTLGHEAGDEVLRKVANLLRDRLRTVDRVYRIGGEEFLVLLYGASAGEAQLIAEELRNSIAIAPILSGQAVTASIGTAALHSSEGRVEWMSRADKNMYMAKQEGRNRVVS